MGGAEQLKASSWASKRPSILRSYSHCKGWRSKVWSRHSRTSFFLIRSTLRAHAHHGCDVASPGSLGAVARLVAVAQYQDIDDFGRCVRAFACDALEFGSFLF